VAKSVDMGRLTADVAQLASLVRDSAGVGERASARWIAGRMRQAGASEVAVESYRGHATFAWIYALHALGGLLAGRLPRWLSWPVVGALLASLEGDASGRWRWLRRLLPSGEGANVVARVRAPGRAAERTLVLVAHHDAQRTGLIWHPALAEPGAARRLRTRVIGGYLNLAALALVLHRTRVGRGLLGLWVALSIEHATNRTVPGANDNGSGVAAVLALVERWTRDPLPGVEILAVTPGCEESGMEGMRAFLAAHALDPARTLVLCLDTLGCGRPIALQAEHALLRHRYAEADLALVPPAVERWTIGGWTDAIQARFAGLRTVSLLSIGPKGLFTHYHRPDDTADNVDWASVEACIDAAVAVAEAFCAER
jgi:Peptidase family M28